MVPHGRPCFSQHLQDLKRWVARDRGTGKEPALHRREMRDRQSCRGSFRAGPRDFFAAVFSNPHITLDK